MKLAGNYGATLDYTFDKFNFDPNHKYSHITINKTITLK